MPLLGAATLPARPAALCWFADETGAAGTSRLLVACEDGTMLRMAPPPVAASPPEDLELTPRIVQRKALRIESAALALAPVPSGLALNRPGGLSFFAACADGALRAYQFNDGCRDAADPAKLQPAPADATWEHHSKAATALATSADGLYVATGGADGVVVVRSLSGADEATTLRLHDSVSGGVAGLCLAHVAARSASGPVTLTLTLTRTLTLTVTVTLTLTLALTLTLTLTLTTGRTAPTTGCASSARTQASACPPPPSRSTATSTRGASRHVAPSALLYP